MSYNKGRRHERRQALPNFSSEQANKAVGIHVVYIQKLDNSSSRMGINFLSRRKTLRLLSVMHWLVIQEIADRIRLHENAPSQQMVHMTAHYGNALFIAEREGVPDVVTMREKMLTSEVPKPVMKKVKSVLSQRQRLCSLRATSRHVLSPSQTSIHHLRPSIRDCPQLHASIITAAPQFLICRFQKTPENGFYWAIHYSGCPTKGSCCSTANRTSCSTSPPLPFQISS